MMINHEQLSPAAQASKPASTTADFNFSILYSDKDQIKSPDLDDPLVTSFLGTENLILSSTVDELVPPPVDKSGLVQWVPRTLIVSDKTVYLLDDEKKLQKRIEIGNLRGILSKIDSEDFLVYEVGYPDVRLYLHSAAKHNIIRVIRKAFSMNSSCTKTLQLACSNEENYFTDLNTLMNRQTKADLQFQETKDDEKIADDGNQGMALVGVDETTVDDFVLIRTLGRGFFAKVMLVRGKRTGKLYAMKILTKDAAITGMQVESTIVERAFKELARHPFIVRLRCAFETPEKLYTFEDFYAGGELFFQLEKKGQFSEDEAKFIVAEVVLALGYIHSLGFVYRDLKPEHILMDREGHIALSGCGLVKQIGDSEGRTNTLCGTPEYLAPEMIKGFPYYGKAVDWWSVGILLYELLTGHSPFYNSDDVVSLYQRILTGPLSFSQGMSSAVKDLIGKLLHRVPTRRLGYGPGDVEHVKAHPFFDSIDWELLYHKQIKPPFKPTFSNVTTDDDVSQFDHEFTDEPTRDSPAPSISHLKDVPEFPNFSYVDPED
eukprot:TRINITY_DN15979_c0_g2_i1.p1 TRINITY_DN15979_c0_g2~~TRINITY_DN15979_c0_g2_i1.p1  ORF type:complete len:546 (-),score=114.26 TRINITY_DN15979_c0_g2_i1:227-1864(-)